jgi:hypothetical protein
MAMLGYFDVFPEKRTTELRTATFTDSNADDLLPDGMFVFTEYFCTDLTCDCQRVLVKVFRARSEDAPPEEVATISYSWNPSADETWEHLNADLPNPFLDPLHQQAPFASELLDFWRTMIKRDRAYATRLQRHYGEIRAEIGTTQEQWDGSHLSSNDGQKGSFRPLTKRERTARKRLLARAHKRK